MIASGISDLNESTDFLNRSSYKYSDPGSMCSGRLDTYDVSTENTNIPTHRGSSNIQMHNSREELEIGGEDREEDREEVKEKEGEEELTRDRDGNKKHGTDLDSSSKYYELNFPYECAVNVRCWFL